MLTSKDKTDTKRLPMMPIRDVVIFPYMMTPFVVGRESSVRALEEALAGDKKIFLATQHDAQIDEPRPDEIYNVGTLANIVQSLKLPDGNIKVLVEGVERGKIISVSEDEGYFRALVKTFNFKVDAGQQLEALVTRVTGLFEQYVKLSQNLNYETMIAAIRVDEPGKLADTVGANLQLTIEEKQELLEIFDPVDRLTRVAEMLDIEIEKLNVDRTIQGRVKRQMEKAQKEYYLNEKIKAIQKELGRGEKSEFDELKRKIDAAGMTKDAYEKSIAELKRLENMPAIIWIGCWPCRGRKRPRKSGISNSPSRCSNRTTTASKKSRNAFSSFSPSAAWCKIPRAPSCVSSDLPASEKLHWECRSPRLPDASSSVCRWAAFAMKRKFAGTGEPTSARCPVRSCR